ncbi:hypothetical protein [Leifsonia sp. 2MCAF36]|uniref:hypothetical protein n=1 Tax=Leifsonia sp. 2MCAF36 TaxID=3232988 RepID=UPI003F98F358
MEERLEQAELDALWLPGDPIASAERLAAAAGEPDRSELVRAELQTQRARALGLQGRIEEAEALLDSLEPAVGVLEVRVLLERGGLRVAAGDPEGATPLLEAALRAARREGVSGLSAECALVLAESDRPHTDQWIEEGLADLSGTDDPRTLRWGVALHLLRGWVRLEDRDAGAALESFADAVKDAEANGTPDQQFAARWGTGRALREIGRVEEALVVQRRLAAERPEEPAVAAELAELTEPAALAASAAPAAHPADEPSSDGAHTIDS